MTFIFPEPPIHGMQNFASSSFVGRRNASAATIDDDRGLSVEANLSGTLAMT